MEPQNNLLSERNKKIWRKNQIPVSPYFELTPRCTLDCKMCYVHLTREQMGDRRELTAEQWNQIADEAVKAGMIYVVLTGGECMLHPGFWDIYHHLLDLGVVVTINTNAYALTDEDIERFKKRPPSGFRVTLYGASEEGYERCTGRRAFQRVMDNIKKLRAAGFWTVVALTLSRYNADEFLEMVKLASYPGIPVNYVMELSPPNEDTGRQIDDFSLSRQEIIDKTLELYQSQNRSVFRNEPITELPALLPDDPNCKGMRCGSGTTSFVIHWDGRMSPCFDFRNDVRVQDVGFQAAWEITKKLARECPQPVECESCRLLPICNDCALTRRDPKNPGHCDPERCRITIERYNAGLTTLEPKEPAAQDLVEGKEEC
ncbi:MAG: radical SAM protein [Oscillospiraceae bacterium]|nr:radical SAM protein [Oscillospiraceae bacterium]